MGIYFTLLPVDSDLVQRNEEWISEYVEERDNEFWEWDQDPIAAMDDPRSQVMLRYQHH
jgi:hypothetical protein